MYDVQNIRITPIRYSVMDENNRVKFCRKLILDFQHVVDEYFYRRVEYFLKSYFRNKYLNSLYYWFRVEYQERGTAHIHGCFKLHSDPGITKLCEVIRDGRIAHHHLYKQKKCIQTEFSAYSRRDNKFLTDETLNSAGVTNPYLSIISPEIEKVLNKRIKLAIEVELIVKKFNDFLFTSINERSQNDSLLDT